MRGSRRGRSEWWDSCTSPAAAMSGAHGNTCRHQGSAGTGITAHPNAPLSGVGRNGWEAETTATTMGRERVLYGHHHGMDTHSSSPDSNSAAKKGAWTAGGVVWLYLAARARQSTISTGRAKHQRMRGFHSQQCTFPVAATLAWMI